MNKTGEIKRLIFDIYQGLELNNFATLGKADAKMYDEPLIGIAAASDSYFEFLKEHIGSFYWSPAEAFALKYGDAPGSDKLCVICMAFPQTEETKNMQNSARLFPSDNWVVSRGEWEPMMREFSGKLESRLEAMGIRSASIDLRPEFHREDSENLGIASLWSHRHTAFAAGLGTFGLSDGFITEKGIAVRFTSIIVEADMDITDRGDRGPYDWCLYYNSGKCGACVARCPVDAISREHGHDKQICLDYEDEAIAKYWPPHIERGDYIFGCGLCQAKVPCRDKRP
ncbi:MAG: epoxyqueuosine reductase [Eubacterium sp.]|nr:epoxyqueuosine reductase [Candidatus Colimonas fimequi]